MLISDIIILTFFQVDLYLGVIEWLLIMNIELWYIESMK